MDQGFEITCKQKMDASHKFYFIFNAIDIDLKLQYAL